MFVSPRLPYADQKSPRGQHPSARRRDADVLTPDVDDPVAVARVAEILLSPEEAVRYRTLLLEQRYAFDTFVEARASLPIDRAGTPI